LSISIVIPQATLSDGTDRAGYFNRDCVYSGVVYRFLTASQGNDWIYVDITIEQSAISIGHIKSEYTRRVIGYRFMVCSTKEISFFEVNKSALQYKDLMPLLNYGGEITELDLHNSYFQLANVTENRLHCQPFRQNWEEGHGEISLLHQLVGLYESFKRGDWWENNETPGFYTFETMPSYDLVTYEIFYAQKDYLIDKGILKLLPNPYKPRPHEPAEGRVIHEIDLSAFKTEILRVMEESGDTEFPPYRAAHIEHLLEADMN
jgi:hypothetical protein